jgi:DNA-directed RNA polymerase alpha subunit
MKHLDLTVFEPGDMLATMSQDGKVAVFTVTLSGQLQPSDNRLFASGLSMDDPIESLQLTVRSYNVLKREGINTIGEMATLYDQGEERMFEIRNFGQKCVDEIGAVLQRLRGTNESQKETP